MLQLVLSQQKMLPSHIISLETFQLLSYLVEIFVSGLAFIALLACDIVRDLSCFLVNLDQNTDVFLHRQLQLMSSSEFIFGHQFEHLFHDGPHFGSKFVRSKSGLCSRLIRLNYDPAQQPILLLPLPVLHLLHHCFLQHL